MCNEREKLIGYLYDEDDSSERDAVRQHLETCGECRVEIASLRSVREDLAAWEVPEHGSVWRPFAAAPTPPWWQHVPQWALAAAAGIVLVAGAAGGAVTHAFMPHGTQAVQTSPTGATRVSDAAELAGLQRQIEQLRADLVAASNRAQPAGVTAVPVMDDASHKAFVRELDELRIQTYNQSLAVESIYANLGQYKKDFIANLGKLRSQVEGMATVLETRSSGGQQ